MTSLDPNELEIMKVLWEAGAEAGRNPRTAFPPGEELGPPLAVGGLDGAGVRHPSQARQGRYLPRDHSPAARLQADPPHGRRLHRRLGRGRSASCSSRRSGPRRTSASCGGSPPRKRLRIDRVDRPRNNNRGSREKSHETRVVQCVGGFAPRAGGDPESHGIARAGLDDPPRHPPRQPARRVLLWRGVAVAILCLPLLGLLLPKLNVPISGLRR